jgi:Sperm-tail PG-rich repeat
MKFTSTPAWSFGLKHKEYDATGEAPGPGEYKVPKGDWGHGFSIPKSPKDKQSHGGIEIGPGHYNYDPSSIKKGGFSIQGKPKSHQ